MRGILIGLLIIVVCEVSVVYSRKTKQADYQIEVYNDSTIIMDGKRVVGVMKYDSTSQFDKIIDADNF